MKVLCPTCNGRKRIADPAWPAYSGSLFGPDKYRHFETREIRPGPFFIDCKTCGTTGWVLKDSEWQEMMSRIRDRIL